MTVVHSFGVFGDAYGKLAAERNAVLAQDFGVLQMKSATEFGGAAGRYEAVVRLPTQPGDRLRLQAWPHVLREWTIDW